MINEIIVLGLASWRLAFFITDDELPQQLKERLLLKLEDRALNQPTTARMWLSVKADYLFNCIYCMTFWTALLLYNIRFLEPIILIGAIWAVATILGVLHNAITDLKTDQDDIN